MTATVDPRPSLGASLSAKDWRYSLMAAIGCITVVGMGLGASLPLLSLALERQGVPSGIIGWNAAMSPLAALIMTPLLPALMRRVPTVALLAVCILVSAGLMIAYPLFPNVWIWFPMRFAAGLAIAVLFVTSEVWVNQLAEEHNRGRMLGLFAAVLSLGFAAGPLALLLVGSEGILAFVFVAALILAALVPLILFGRGRAPSITERPTTSFFTFLVVAPAATLAGFIYGATETNIFNLLPVYALRIGLSEPLAATVLSVFAAGTILLQFPIGMLADRFDRRLVLSFCAFVGVVGICALPFAARNYAVFASVLFVYGGVIVGLYTVGLTLLGERFRGADLAAANAAFVMMFAAGGLAGPIIAGEAMEAWNPHGFIVAMAVLCLIYLAVAFWRWLVPPKTAP